jgi:hypothetical protein
MNIIVLERLFVRLDQKFPSLPPVYCGAQRFITVCSQGTALGPNPEVVECGHTMTPYLLMVRPA